jgi:hypothetical protein
VHTFFSPAQGISDTLFLLFSLSLNLRSLRSVGPAGLPPTSSVGPAGLPPTSSVGPAGLPPTFSILIHGLLFLQDQPQHRFPRTAPSLIQATILLLSQPTCSQVDPLSRFYPQSSVLKDLPTTGTLSMGLLSPNCRLEPKHDEMEGIHLSVLDQRAPAFPFHFLNSFWLTPFYKSYAVCLGLLFICTQSNMELQIPARWTVHHLARKGTHGAHSDLTAKSIHGTTCSFSLQNCLRNPIITIPLAAADRGTKAHPHDSQSGHQGTPFCYLLQNSTPSAFSFATTANLFSK